jgi:hypothetical protein
MSAISSEDLDIKNLANLLAGSFNNDQGQGDSVPARFKFHSSIALILYSGYLIS